MNSQKIGNFQTITRKVALALDTSQYAAGDVLSDTVEIALADVAPATGRLRIEIVELKVLDKDDQGGLLDVVFLKSNVSLGTKNAAISISAADAAQILGTVEVTSYKDFVNSQHARPGFDPINAELDSQRLYVSAVSRDTKTYTAAGLELTVSVRLHNLPVV